MKKLGNAIKLGLIASFLVVAACDTGMKRKNRAGAPAEKPGGGGNEREVGGVDVGNVTVSGVPGTKVVISHEWAAQVEKRELQLASKKKSSIRGQKIELVGITSPSSEELLALYQEKYPNRKYREYNYNGFFGIRADNLPSTRGVNSVGGAQKLNFSPQRSHVVLVAQEHADQVEFYTEYLTAEDQKSGDMALSTVRIIFKGDALTNQPVVQIKMMARVKHGSDKAYYSFKEECFPFDDNKPENCGRAVTAGFANGRGDLLEVGNAGYDDGRIIELGPDAEVSFDKVVIKGRFLESPKTKTPLTEIYSKFSPKAPMKRRDEIQLKEGVVYLLRTISWPEEDLLIKFRVKELVSGDYVVIDYQKLAKIPVKILIGYVDQLNKHTRDHEMKQDSGIVTLYSRYNWGDYVSATLNFKFGTRDNVYIAGNSWDLIYEGRSDLNYFDSPTSWHGVSGIRDLGEKELGEVELKDFMTINESAEALQDRRRRVEVVEGHTYSIVNFEGDAEFAYGAVKVLKLDPERRFVKLQWRRVAILKASEEQKWHPVDLDNTKVERVVLEVNSQGQNRSTFLPGQNLRGDMTEIYSEVLSLDPHQGDDFTVDNRHYPNAAGLIYLGAGDLIAVSLQDIEAKAGQFTGYLPVKKGLYAARIMNLWEKSVMVFEVINIDQGKSVEIKYRRLFVGQLLEGHFSMP